MAKYRIKVRAYERNNCVVAWYQAQKRVFLVWWDLSYSRVSRNGAQEVIDDDIRCNTKTKYTSRIIKVD